MRLRIPILILVLANSSVAAAAQPWEQANAADAAMIAYLAAYKTPNVSVAVAKGGRILYQEGWQWTDSAKPIEGGDRWLFRLASVSKPITAILAMELVQEGKLDLDKPIREYVPTLPPNHSYTPRDLLGHLAGVRHYLPLASDPTVRGDKFFETASSALTLFASDPLVGEPREKYSYSTHGFTVLAAAIEKVVRKPFPSYALSRFKEWGLSSLRPEIRIENPQDRIGIYDSRNGKTERDDLSWKFAGGGFESSARDLCKLADSLFNGFILTSEYRKQMWVTGTTRDGKMTDYGLGWRIGVENGKPVVSHSGGQRGANSFWKVYPDDGVVVVVLTNREATQPSKLADYLSTLAFAIGPLPAPVF